MQVWDFDGTCDVNSADAILARLQSVRRGPDGAFIRSHGADASLWVHINGDAAFLYYFPDKDGTHAGFVPDEMWSGEKRDVRFLLVGGDEGIEISWYQLVPLEVAYRAAVEFLNSPELPASVRWFEL